MKKFLTVLLVLVLGLALALGIAIFTGLTTIDDLRSIFSADNFARLQASIDDAAQQVRSGAEQLYSQLADHKPPSGEGAPQEGDLPTDLVPDAEGLYSFPAEIYPYRAMLDAAEQAAYDQVYAYAMEQLESLPLHTPVPTDSIARIMSAVFYDHPELFWIETAYRYFYNSSGNVVSITLVYNELADDMDTHKARFDQMANAIIAEASQLGSDFEKEKYVHDWLLDNVDYDLAAPLNQSAYSALIYGETVCAGYSRAFQYLLQQLNIPTYYCAGYAGEAHAWNIVKLDDGYYHVDVAWNDPLGNESNRRYYNYFNLTDAEISADHTRTEMSVNLPACNATGYSYENMFGTQEQRSSSTGESTPASTLRTLEDAGYSRSDAVSSVREYYSRCEAMLVELGTGSHSFSMLLQDGALVDEIFQLTQNRQALEQYVLPAAESLGLSGYSASVSLQAEALEDGYYLLTHAIQWTGQEQARESTEPEPPEQLLGDDPPDEFAAAAAPDDAPPPNDGGRRGPG